MDVLKNPDVHLHGAFSGTASLKNLSVSSDTPCVFTPRIVVKFAANLKHQGFSGRPYEIN